MSGLRPKLIWTIRFLSRDAMHARHVLIYLKEKQYALLRSTGVRVGGGESAWCPSTPSWGGCAPRLPRLRRLWGPGPSLAPGLTPLPLAYVTDNESNKFWDYYVSLCIVSVMCRFCFEKKIQWSRVWGAKQTLELKLPQNAQEQL